MAKYFVQVSYTTEGVKGLLNDGGTKRRAVVDKLFKSLGGSVENFYYAFGESDLIIIADFPDNASVASAVLTVVGTGAVGCKTTVLLTPEDIDQAAKKSPSYSPPGN